MQIAPGLDIGIIFLVMMATGGVYGIVIGGWASNNKYSFFGGLRSVAQMLSYEVPFGLCLLCMVLMTGNLRLEVVVEKQLQFGWFILYQPITFILMFVCALAECNRLPFDTPEAEQELVVGYHTEYSSMEFGMFFLGEYAHIIASSALLSTLFLGGWHFPMLTPAVEGGIFQTIIKLAVISAKIFVFIFVFMLARWTLPRFRFDQTLRIGWLGLVPMSMSLVILTGVMTYLKLERTVWMTLANIGVVVAAYLVGWLVMLTKKKLPEEAV
jgi:NADH-quinone oxidoreductase subunit H